VVGGEGQGEHEGQEPRGVARRERGEERVEERRVRVRVVRQEPGRVGEVGVGVAGEEGEEAARMGGVGGEAQADQLRVVLPQLGDRKCVCVARKTRTSQSL